MCLFRDVSFMRTLLKDSVRGPFQLEEGMIHARIGYFPQPERWGCPCTLRSRAGLWEPNAAWPTHLAMGFRNGFSCGLETAEGDVAPG